MTTTLPPQEIPDDPFVWFERELNRAREAGLPEPTAMQLATVSSEGFPSVRTVLFKGLVRGGFSFYTNYDSQKAREIRGQPRAALNFFWAPLEEQIRIEGEVHRLSRAESEAYFKTRPRISQIGAWASEQSRTIPNLGWLEQRVTEFEKKYEGKDVPCPLNWGGYHLVPLRIEFWLGRQGRLHERYVFERASSQTTEWTRSMKSP